jgi:hypothetical protein
MMACAHLPSPSRTSRSRLGRPEFVVLDLLQGVDFAPDRSFPLVNTPGLSGKPDQSVIITDEFQPIGP